MQNVKINGRTPEEIKKAHECCFDMICYEGECAYESERNNWTKGGCFNKRGRDALEYIQKLENQIGELTEMVEQLEKERNALLADLRDADSVECNHCAHYKCDGHCWGCGSEDCPCKTCLKDSNWKWRGVQEGE